MTDIEIENAVKKALATPELAAKIDRRLKYDLLNQDKRIVSMAKKLLALSQADMLQLKDGTK